MDKSNHQLRIFHEKVKEIREHAIHKTWYIKQSIVEGSQAINIYGDIHIVSFEEIIELMNKYSIYLHYRLITGVIVVWQRFL